MARQLQALTLALTLEPKVYRLRAGQAVGELPSADADAVAWDVPSSTDLVGGDELGAGWEGLVDSQRWPARARLAPSSSYTFTTDTVYDTGANGPRTVRTPTLEAAGVRAWLGVELGYAEPDATTSVLFRVYDADTGDELYWTGAEWAAGTPGDDTVAEWTTAQDVQDNFAQLPGDLRKLAILAWLRTSSASYSPSFYGARVVYGVRQVSPLDDALFRTLVASLRSELEASAVLELTWPTGGEIALTVPEAAQGYQVTGLDAAFNLSDDPDELTELGGSYNAGTGLWAPSPTPGAGEAVRVELRYTPDVVARRHQDLEDLAQLPAVYLAPSGGATRLYRAQGYTLIRDVNATPPVALEVPDPELETVPLELRAVAELGADVDRLAQALTRWLTTRPDGAPGLGGSRELVSPETGQVVHVQALGRPTASSALFAQGVAEVRAAWLLTFARASAHTTTTAPLVSASGISLSTLARE